MNRYPLNIFWSDEDKGFSAEAPDLPGCSAWGGTEADAAREAQDAITARLHKEPDKAEAVHPEYGRVFIAGHRRNETEFLLLRKGERALGGDGAFALERLRWT